MINIYNAKCEVISTSRNLRGIHERNRKQKASLIVITEMPDGGAAFFILWPDESFTSVTFASFKVCVEHANRRIFATATKTIHRA